MIKPTLIFFLLLAGPAVAQAQQRSLFGQDDDAVPRVFYGGLTAGANFSQVDGDGLEGYHQVGFHAGPLVYAHLAGSFYASMEILFAQKGSKWRAITESQYTGSGVEGYDLRLNYAEVPLMLHVAYRPRFSAGAGISYARLISFNESAYANYPINLHPDINYFRKDDICGLGEVSYEFWRGWLILMRFSYSLTSIRDAERIPQGYGGGYFAGQWNNAFTLRLVYFFREKASQ